MGAQQCEALCFRAWGFRELHRGRNNAKRYGLEHGFSANCMGAQQCEALCFRAWGFRELHRGRNNAKRCVLELGVSANSIGGATMRSIVV